MASVQAEYRGLYRDYKLAVADATAQINVGSITWTRYQEAIADAMVRWQAAQLALDAALSSGKSGV